MPFFSSLLPKMRLYSTYPAACMLAAATGMIFAAPANAQLTDSHITATYKVEYNGIGIGKVNFNSTVKGDRYKMESHSKFQVPLLGSIFNSLRWRAISRASGRVHGTKPKPNDYYFAFQNNKKHGKVDMKFTGNRISRVERVPNKPLSAANIQVTRAHLRNVYDPMSALLVVSRKGKSHRTACSGTVPIYDGKQRFNLKLSYKRAVRLRRSQSGGYRGPVIVCRVRYQPISGYKPHKKETKFMLNNKGIELWLMPLPGTRNYAPYRFHLPLPVGEADAYLAKFNIRHKNGRKVALVRQ